jgi:hypothetical protein
MMTLRRQITPRVAVILVMGLFMLPFVFWHVGLWRDFNQNSIETTCTVENVYINNETCSYQCSCVSRCLVGLDRSDSIHCWPECQTCYSSCQKGYLTIIHVFPNKKSISQNITVGVIDQNIFFNTYNLTETIICYMHKKTFELRISRTEDSNYFILHIGCTIIAGGILLAWSCVEIYKVIKAIINGQINSV